MTQAGDTRINQRELPADWRPSGQLHPVVERVYAARGVLAAAADLSLNALLPPTLDGLDVAARRLAEAVVGDESICIVGDYDCDGATSTALALSMLREMGANHVDFIVPNRFSTGYGLSPPIVNEAAQRGVELIITVDNGISAIAGVDAANAAGIDVIVTDHHLPGEQQPAAVAIVNPNNHGDTFPSKSLAGVGVVFYLMSALRAELSQRGALAAPPRLADALDLVALGTVADVVRLDRNNRILVEQGLRRMRAGRLRPGLAALINVAGRDHRHLSAADLGFTVGPRLNAAGRLDDMGTGIRCLLAGSEGEAAELAAELNTFNAQRRAIESDMVDDAVLKLPETGTGTGTGTGAVGVCLSDETWHEGIVGLVAGRIRERIHRPVVAFAPAQDGVSLKGSARSIPGLHIRDVIARVATLAPDLISAFGGHAMAAGLSIARDDFDAFAAHFDRVCSDWLDSADLEREYLTDGALAPADLSLETARALEDAGPWGQGFPEPLFDGEFQVVDRRIVGERHAKYRLRSADGATIGAIHFGGAEQGTARRLRVLYHLVVNRWRDRADAELRLAECWPAAD